MIIRPFDGSDHDYAAITRIHNAVYPEMPRTEENARLEDARRTEAYKFGRLLALVDGKAVGEAFYGQFPDSHRPGKFRLNVQVMPDYQNQGIGAALYDAIRAAVATHDPTYFFTYIMEPDHVSRAFAEKREFVYAMRYPMSKLDLTQFDAAAFADQIARFEANGYTIHSLAELKASDAGWSKKLHWLINTVAEDIPAPEPHVWSEHDEWLPRFESYQTLIHEAYFVVLDAEGHWVGMSFVLKELARPTVLAQALTGTLRQHRRQGIALALKVHGSQWAQANGYETIETDNEESNPMYALNMRLGYRPFTTDTEYIWELKKGDS